MPTKTRVKPKKRNSPPRPAAVSKTAASKAATSVVAPLPASASISPAAHIPSAGRSQQAKLNFSLCLLLALLTFVVYFRATKNPFVNFDDQAYVIENLNVQQGLTAATVKWAFTSLYAANWHPLTWLSHALDWSLFGMNPAGHHLTSVLLHILNVVILFLILAKVTGSKSRSFVVAALFALHPINVESVAWVAERKNVLSMFFLLLTLAAYGWYARKPQLGRYVAAFVLFGLALAAKPMVVTLPFLLLLIDYWPLQRALGSGLASQSFPVPQFPFWRLALEKVPLLLLSAGSSVITVIAQRSTISLSERLPLTTRFSNAIYAYSAYLFKTFWPAHLASFYPYEGSRIATWIVLLLLVFLVGVTARVWRERSRHTYMPVGWFWFLGSLVPMIGLVQVGAQAMADRYAYLPLIGIFCMVVWGVSDLAQNLKWNPKLVPVAVGVVLAALSWTTWRQIRIWHSSLDLWSHALSVTRDNWMAENYVGTAILVEKFEATGARHSDEALVHFQNAVRINPQDAISHLNLGADLHEHGRLQEAMYQYKMVLGLTEDPHLVAKTLIDLGAVSQELGEFSSAKQYDLEAMKTEPGNMVAFENLGKAAMDERIQQLSRAASVAPSTNAYLQLGELQEAAQHFPEARASYEQALKLNPKSAEVQQALAQLSHESLR